MFQPITMNEKIMTIKLANSVNTATKPPHQTMIGENVCFARTRRITGYLVGTVDRFNNAKQAEEKDRVKHDCSPTTP